MVGKDGYLKLIDFGLAKKLSVNRPNNNFTYCGTSVYMAPEIL